MRFPVRSGWYLRPEEVREWNWGHTFYPTRPEYCSVRFPRFLLHHHNTNNGKQNGYKNKRNQFRNKAGFIFVYILCHNMLYANPYMFQSHNLPVLFLLSLYVHMHLQRSSNSLLPWSHSHYLSYNLRHMLYKMSLLHLRTSCPCRNLSTAHID